MAMHETPDYYEFRSLFNMMDFIKPLAVEGYTIAIKTVYKQFPRENDIDKFIVMVGPKGKDIKVFVTEDDETTLSSSSGKQT